MRGCNGENELYQDSFTKPLPYVGLYVAGASVLCGLLMLADAIQGVLKRKLWFPCSCFPLNATTLTILGVATKFPVDLNTSMPGRFDQLSKLTGTVLICTVMGNFMPSLGNLGESELVSNVVALGILVITVIANIGIQMGTGVIYQFWPEHIAVVVFMFLILAILAASVLPVPVTKKLLEDKFDNMYEKAKDQCTTEGAEGPQDEKGLKAMVEKFWLMAHTASPQYVMGRSATCMASGAFCLLGAAVVLEAFLRSQVHHSTMFCSGDSDYGWSTKLVFSAQAATIAVGTVAPAWRWFNAISFKSKYNVMKEFTVEDYWTEKLKEWKNEPLPFDNGSRRERKLAYGIKAFRVYVLTKLQQGMVLLSKFVRMISIFLWSWLPALKRWIFPSPPTDSTENLREFVLHLQGEEDLVDIIITSEQKDVEKWIDKGKNKGPTELIELITKGNSQIRSGFQGVAVVDDSRVPSLIIDQNGHRVGGLMDAEKPDEVSEPPNCWAMPIVTLVSIAMALPDVDKKEMKSLQKQIYQGLKYVRCIEKQLDGRGMVDARDSADFLWKTLEIHGKWFGVDLNGLSTKIGSTTYCWIVKELHKLAEDKFNCFWMKEREKENKRRFVEWPGEVHAAYCMYKMTVRILLDYEGGQHSTASSSSSYPYLPRTDGNLFPWIRTTISDIIRACLTNIPHLIYLSCITNSVEQREESVREAAFLLGEAAENILPILQQQEQEFHLDNKERAYIDDWASKIGQNIFTTGQSSTPYFTPLTGFPPSDRGSLRP